MKRPIAILALCAVTVGLVLVGRVMVQSRSAYARATAADSAGKVTAAITDYRRAIQWYLPLNPYVGRSVKRLFALGEQSERGGKLQLALMAYRSLRASLYSVRSVYTPHAKVIAACDARIARIMALLKKKARPSVVVAREQARYLRQLKIDHAPSVFWSIVMVGAFFGWAVLGFVLIWRGFDAAGKLMPRRALPLASALLGCLILWFVGMRLA